MTGFERRAHEPLARIGDERRARVAHERDARAARERGEHKLAALPLVVPVQRDRLSGDPVAIEQHARVARVLGQHELGLAQHAQCAQRHVLEVADRRRHEMQRAQGQDALDSG
jgi:hypothetical protein